jgi:hypothetical protein
MKYVGPNHVKFNNTGQKISFTYPNSKMGGMIFGSRTMLIDGNLTLWDEENQIKAVLFFNREGDSFDQITGRVYRYDPNGKKQKKEPNKVKDITDMVGELIYEVKGSWLKELTFNGE